MSGRDVVRLRTKTVGGAEGAADPVRFTEDGLGFRANQCITVKKQLVQGSSS